MAQQESTVINDSGRLPAQWLANGPGSHGTVVNALWALREYMMKDSLGIAKILWPDTKPGDTKKEEVSKPVNSGQSAAVTLLPAAFSFSVSTSVSELGWGWGCPALPCSTHYLVLSCLFYLRVVALPLPLLNI